MNDAVERLRCLRSARTLSALGPDFNDELTIEAWIEKLKDIPLDLFKITLAKLSGKKYFPSPQDILDVAVANKDKAKKTSDKEEECFHSEPRYAKRKLYRFLTNAEKMEYNSDENKASKRKVLIENIYLTEEMVWLQRHYPESWDEIFENILQLSYFEEFHEQLRNYAKSPGYLITDMLPQEEFDFDPKRGRKLWLVK